MGQDSSFQQEDDTHQLEVYALQLVQMQMGNL